MALAGRQGRAALLHFVSVRVGQAVDKAVGVDIAGRLRDSRVRQLGSTEADVAGNVAGKEKDVLLHQTEAPPQCFHIPLADVDAIDQDLPPLNLVKAAQQADDGSLARAGGPD